MSVSNKFIEEISGDWTVKTTTADGLITLDTGLPGTTLVTGDLSVVGNVNFAGNAAIISNAISNGTSTIIIPDASGNAVVKIGGSNIANFYVGGFSTVGNITSDYIFGNGAFITGLPAGYSNANVASYLPVYTGNLVSLQGPVTTTANITANYFLGNGSQLSGLNPMLTVSNWEVGNVISNVIANVKYLRFNANSGITVSNIGNDAALVTLGSSFKTWEVAGQANLVAVGEDIVQFVAGNNIVITTNAIAYPQQIAFATSNNITATTFSAIGNIAGGNLLTVGYVSAAGNITGNYFVGNGSLLTGVTANDVGVLANISVTGNAVVGNLLTGGNISAGGNITGGDIYGANLSLSGNAIIDGRIVGNTVRIGTDAGLTNQGDGAVALGVNAGSSNQGANAIAIGKNAGITNQSSNSIILNATGTTLNTTAPGLYISPIRSDNANIDSVVMYNTGTKELTYANSISLSGNVDAGYFVGDGSQLTNIQANVLIGNTLSPNVIYSSLTTVGTLSELSVVGDVDITGNLNVTGNATLSGNILGDRIVNGNTEVTIDVPGGNVAVTVNGVGNVAVFTPNGFEVAGNVSATGNITGNYILGNGAFLTGVATSQGIANGTSNVSVPVANGNIVISVNGISNVAVFDENGLSTTGNVVAGNVLTNNLLYANGQPWDFQLPAGANTQIQFNDNGDFGASANLTFDTDTNIFYTSNIATGGTVSATGNITGGNVLSLGLISTAANIVGGNLLTTGLISATGNLTSGNVDTAGSVTASGNVDAGNLVSQGDVTAIGNVASGNVLTTGQVSATGNVTGGNLVTVGNVSASNLLVTTVSASGNVTAGNIETSGAVSATGNIYGDSMSLSGNVVIDGRIQGPNVKIGTDAGLTNQSYNGVAIGLNAGYSNQGLNAVAIGSGAGETNQSANSIAINASSVSLNAANPGFYVNPVRNDTANTANVVTYNVNTKELTYSNTLSLAGNITAGNLQFTDASATGNVLIDGDLSVTGNAFLSGNIVGDRIQNGNTIIDIQTPGGNANVSVGGVNNVAVFSPEGISLPGNVTAGNVITDNLLGISNINIATASGNLTVSVDGTGNVAVFTSAGLNIIGNLSVTGNVIGDYFVGNGTALTGVMADRGSDPNNWDTLTQMGVYTVNRISWSGTTGTPLDSQIYVGLLEVKNSTGLALEQNFYPGTVQTANVRTQWNRNYWSGSWTAWYFVVNDDQVVSGGDF